MVSLPRTFVFISMHFERWLYPALILAACAPVAAQQPVGDLVAPDASVKGSVVLAAGGAKVASGSAINAGANSASLRLARGGEVRICPRTGLSVSSSETGRDLMLGMSTGAIETHYQLLNSADTVMTPDFRILFAGPGTFHFAISADARGNTCVKALAGNTSSLIVSEVMGDGVYQVRAHDQVMFHNGSVASPEMNPVVDCGCPPPVPGGRTFLVKRADVKPKTEAAARPEPAKPAVEPKSKTPRPQSVPEAAKLFEKPIAAQPQRTTAPADLTTPPPPLDPNDIHVEVDAPFVFRATEPIPPPITVARLHLSSTPLLQPMTVLPPPPAPRPAPSEAKAPKQKKRGFFGRIGSFFASIFH
ncbi:MAG: hypothetical protein ACE14M_01035 [Terriglobales bacterium]